MTSEQRFNREVWWVLQRIEEESYATVAGEPVRYEVAHLITSYVPSYERQKKIIHKLQEWGAIKIVKEMPADWRGSGRHIFEIELQQPKFKEIYKRFQSLCDLTVFLNTYQDEILRVARDEVKIENANIPTFAHVELTQPEKTPIRVTTPKNPSVIKTKTLELIAQEIGNLDTGGNLINFLVDCGVDNKLIEYPQTKWRMVNTVLQTLATSENPKDFRVLYKIIEEACHPLTHKGNEEQAKEITNKFNNLLKYDDIHLEDGKLFRKSDYDDEWIGSDGEVIEPEAHLIMPQDVAKLYVFWNELIRITKIYLSNPDKQSDELNEIYFELIRKIEDILENKRCGSLHLSYKRPFKNLIGCEYEVRKIGKEADGILINLFAFFGEITATSLPTKEFVEDVKKECRNLLDKIETYINNHAPVTEVVKEKITELQPIPIRIVSGKMEIEGLEKGLGAIAKTSKEDKNKFPYKLQAGTRWENFTIKFLDDENVFIQVKQFEHNTDYKGLGLVGRGTNPNPSEGWIFLKVLAKVNGELTFKDPEAKDKYKKQKELLAKSLQGYFSLDYDPFYPYRSSSEKSGNSYKIKITLIPPPDQNKEEIISEDEDALGIKEYLDEEAKQVYDKNE